MEYKIHFC